MKHLNEEQTKFFLSGKDRLLSKKILLHHFTRCSLNRLPKIDSTATFDRLYDALPYLKSPYFMVSNVKNKEYKLEGITTKDYLAVPFDKGKDVVVGDIVNNMLVRSIIKINKPKNHPYYDLISKDIFDTMSGKYILLRLGRLDSPVEPTKNDTIYGVVYQDISGIKDFDPITLEVVEIGSGDSAPFSFTDTIDITPKDINNLDSNITTTIGNFVVNKLILSDIFGRNIPYQKDIKGSAAFNLGKIDNLVAELILQGKAGRKEYDQYMQSGYFLGHLTQLGVGALSRRAMTTAPDMEEYKAKLLQKYKDQLDDPLIYSKIEKELIDKDKEWIKGDSVEKFFAITAKKSYNEHRKKMYLTFGVMQQFDEQANKYQTIQHSLSEGLSVPDLAKSNNELRRGTYSRGKGTAKGGEQTDLLLRFLNSVQITMDDCGSQDGLNIYLSEDNWKDYEGRTLVNKDILSSENKSKYINTTVEMRSNMYCKAKHGHCFTCSGNLMKLLSNTAIGVSSLKIGSKFTSIEMKAMHFSGISTGKLGDISKYFM